MLTQNKILKPKPECQKDKDPIFPYFIASQGPSPEPGKEEVFGKNLLH